MSKLKTNKTVYLQFLTSEGCSDCWHAKRIFDEVKDKFPDLKLEVEEIDVTSLKGLELVIKHSVMSNPGIIINGELFSTGSLDKEKFISKILSLH